MDSRIVQCYKAGMQVNSGKVSIYVISKLFVSWLIFLLPCCSLE